MSIKIIGDGYLAHRLKVRRVDEVRVGEAARKRSLEKRVWCVELDHGGSVANKYGYPASTECALALSDPNGLTVVWLSRAPANKITMRGAAEACVIGAGPLWDLRVRSKEKIDTAWEVLKRCHSRHWSALEQLGAVAEDTHD